MAASDARLSAATFSGTWASIKLVLASPDQRSLAHGLPRATHSRLDALFATLTQELRCTSKGPCLAFVRKNDVLPTLVSSAISDTPTGVRGAVLIGLAQFIHTADVPTLVDPTAARSIKNLLLSLASDVALFAPDAAAPDSSSDTSSLVSVFSESESAAWVVRDDPSDFGVSVYPDSRSTLHEPSMASGSTASPSLEGIIKFLTAVVERTCAHPAGLLSAWSSHSGKLNRFLPWDALMPFVSLPSSLGTEARTALLQCIDLAMQRRSYTDLSAYSLEGEPDLGLQSLSLAHQIAQSDWAPMLSAALGAAYGWLPRAMRLSLARSQKLGSQADAHDLGGVPVGACVATSEDKDQGAVEDSFPASPYRINEDLPVPEDEQVTVPLANFMNLIEFTSAILTSLLEPGPSESVQLSTEDTRTAHTERVHVGLNLAWRLTTGIRSLFVHQIFYPAMLECSDYDGSATAVLFYLTFILRTVPDTSPLAPVLLGILAADEDEISSLNQEEFEHPSPLRFRYTLKNFLLAHLSSSTPRDTHVQALQLVQTLFHDHGRFAVRLLMQPTYLPHATNFPPTPDLSPQETWPSAETKEGVQIGTTLNQRSPSRSRVPNGQATTTHENQALETMEQHCLQLRLLAALVQALLPHSIGSGTDQFHVPGLGSGLAALTESPGQGDKAFSFASAQLEALKLVASDSIFQWEMFCLQYSSSHRTGPESVQAPMSLNLGHRPSPNDRLWRLLTLSLAQWFVNDPQVNLALSGVVTALAACPIRNLEGWISFNKQNSTHGDIHSEEDEEVPVVLFVLRSLVSQVGSLRQQVGEKMEPLLTERMAGFVFVDQLADALADPLLDEIRPLGGVGRKGYSGTVGELVSSSKVRKAWSSLLPKAGEQGSMNLVESTAQVLYSQIPVDAPDENRRSTPRPLRGGLARLFAGRGAEEMTSRAQSHTSQPNHLSHTASQASSNTSSSSTHSSTQAKPRSPAFVPTGRPFAQHYTRTQAVHVLVDPVVLPIAWRRQDKTLRFALDPALSGDKHREQPRGKSSQKAHAKPSGKHDRSSVSWDKDKAGEKTKTESVDVAGKVVSLSSVLDNIVLLREMIREIAAVLTARWAMGVDA